MTVLDLYYIMYKCSVEQNFTLVQGRGRKRTWQQSKLVKTKHWIAHCVDSSVVALATVSSVTFVKRNNTKNQAFAVRRRQKLLVNVAECSLWLNRKSCLFFDGKTTAQSYVFCSVTDLPGMRPHNNTCLVCVLSAKTLALNKHYSRFRHYVINRSQPYLHL